MIQIKISDPRSLGSSQRYQSIHTDREFIGFFDAPWSKWSCDYSILAAFSRNDPDQDQWSKFAWIKSKEPMNPFWAIRFLWCTMIQVVLRLIHFVIIPWKWTELGSMILDHGETQNRQSMYSRPSDFFEVVLNHLFWFESSQSNARIQVQHVEYHAWGRELS